MWYRAQVINSDIDITNVEFIDFGGINSIPSSDLLKELLCYLKDLKKYATLCKLNIHPTVDDWNICACSRFKQYASDELSLEIRVLNKTLNLITVNLISDGKSLSNILRL